MEEANSFSENASCMRTAMASLCWSLSDQMVVRPSPKMKTRKKARCGHKTKMRLTFNTELGFVATRALSFINTHPDRTSTNPVSINSACRVSYRRMGSELWPRSCCRSSPTKRGGSGRRSRRPRPPSRCRSSGAARAGRCKLNRNFNRE